MTMFYALVVLCLTGNALTQIPSLGSCPHIETQSNFDIQKYEGKWYIVERYFTLFEFRSKCNEADFTLLNNGSVKVVHSFLSGFTRRSLSVTLDFKPDSENPAKMTTVIPMTPLGRTSSCYILGTDYDSYSTLYCCTDYKFINLKWSWILMRDPNPDVYTIDKAHRTFEKKNVERKRFWKINQQNCSRKQ